MFSLQLLLRSSSTSKTHERPERKPKLTNSWVLSVVCRRNNNNSNNNNKQNINQHSHSHRKATSNSELKPEWLILISTSIGCVFLLLRHFDSWCSPETFIFNGTVQNWRISRCVMPNNCNFWPGDWLLKWKKKFYFALLFLVPWCTNALITNYASVWTFPESKVTTSAHQRRSNSCWKKQNPRLWWLLKDLSEKRCIGYWNAFHRLNLEPFTLPKENWHFISCYESKSLTDLS